jgi:hypothetical protein
MGSAALKLHFTLSVIGAESTMSSSTSPWTESDRDTFDAYCELENSFNLVEPHADVDGSDVVALAHKVQHLNASLPFREGERLWLIEAERQVSRDGFDFPTGLLTAEATVTSAGRHHVVQGHDLLRRWAAWRRETDEFAEQRTVQEAREHAQNIARQVLTSRDYDDELASLQRRQRPI